MKPAPLNLGRYALIRRLATGGMGEVFLAEVQGAANFTKRVAIKRILPHLARNEDFVRKFIDEANVTVQLHHGNIVPVIELVENDGELFLVMEYLPGRDLKNVLRRARQDQKPFPVDLALWVVAEVCDGLDYAHRKTGPDGRPLHIVHRDVSPSNIVLGAGGEVKVLDFGIARARGGLHQSVSGMLQGKFVYMSPEQADGRRVDPRSDVFSAGLVLYELLTGTRPLEGESETETLRLVRECRVAAPSAFRTEVPAAIDQIVMKAVSRDPEQRFESAGAMRRELVQHLAATRSNADAGALSAYLAGLFPEGVIPSDTPEAGPLSLDDALELQLGALTPGRDAIGNTRTLTGPSGEVPVSAPQAARLAGSQPGWTPGSQPGSGSQQVLSGSQPGVPMRRATDRGGDSGPYPSGSYPPSYPAGSYPGPGSSGSMPVLPGGDLRRRSPLVAAITTSVAIIAVTVAVWAIWPREVRVDPVVEPAAIAKDVRYVVDEETKPWKAPMSLSRGKHYICARAEGYEKDCQWVVAGSADPPKFELKPAPTLEPQVEPREATLTLDGKPFAPPGKLERDKSYKLCGDAPGHEHDCVDFLATAGKNTPRLVLPALPAEVVPAPASAPDAGVAEAPRPEAQRPRSRTVRFEVTPPDAYLVDEAGERLPELSLTLEGNDRRRIRVEAPGYAPQTFNLGADTGARVKATLEKQRSGKLTARADPPAAKIFIDGKEYDTNPITVELPAGRYELTAVWFDGIKDVTKKDFVTVIADDTVHKYLPVVRPPQEAP